MAPGKRFFLSLTFAFGLSAFGLATTPSQLVNPSKEKFLHLARASVVAADYAALRADFPQLKDLTESQIDELLIEHAAFVSVPQSHKNQVNREIPLDGRNVIGYRPQAYGRAAVFSFLSGMLDVKGVGSRTFPQAEAKKDGLMPLSEALREFVYEQAVRLMLAREGYEPGTVKSYAVVSAGFDMIRKFGSEQPAGLLIRQAHARDPESPAGITPARKSSAVEAILRHYGVSSDDDLVTYDWQTLDHNNVQADKDGKIFDFGSYIVLREFSHSPSNPDESLRLPFATWGAYGNSEAPTKDRLRKWANEVAFRFRDRIIGRRDVQKEIARWLDPIKEKLANPCMQILQGPAQLN